MRYKPFINIWQLYTKALKRRFEEIKTEVMKGEKK